MENTNVTNVSKKETKKVYSENLKKEFEIEVEVYEDGSEYITHHSLEKIIWAERIKYNYPSKDYNSIRPVVECAMTYDGYTITMPGEAGIKTLANAVSRLYPATMAYKRAFDNAALAVLGWQKLLKSEFEAIPTEEVGVISIVSDEDATDDEFKAESKNSSEEVKNILNNTQSSSNVTETPAEKPVETKVDTEPTPMEESKPEPTPAAPTVAKKLTDTERRMKFNFGALNGKTLGEIEDAPDSDDFKKLKNMINVIDKVSNADQKQILLIAKKMMM